jgi:hypothetical protein
LGLIAQKTISGKVLTSKNLPLEGAAVYLNNTAIGTTTNEHGEFELSVKDGSYDLIASFLGFETVRFALDTKSINSSIVFKLKAKANMLKEVVVSNKHSKISPQERELYLSQFRLAFLGKTNLSFLCKILNEDDIDFEYNLETHLLEAYASAPIVIDHEGLGYTIYYDLVHFELTKKRVTFLGYTRYENKKGSKRKKRRWKKRRKVAYNGSLTHFLQTIMKGELKKAGYVVDHFERILNPARPSDSIIALAEKDFRAMSGKNNQYLGNKAVENKLRDSLRNILRKANLDKFLEKTIKQNLTVSEFTENTNGTYYMKFPDYLKVKYMKEPEEVNFRRGLAKLNYQVSKTTLYVKRAKIDPIGVLVNPLEMFLEGYWSYEKIGDALPLDYDPKN